MDSGIWVINPAFLQMGRLAYQEIINQLPQSWAHGDGTDKELTEILLALVIINSIHWRHSMIRYPNTKHFLDAGISTPIGEKLETFIKKQIDEKWLKKNIKTTLLPDLAWGGAPDVIRETAKAYLKDGVDGFNLSAKIGDSNGEEEEVIFDRSSGFSFPIYGFIMRIIPQSINYSTLKLFQ